MRISDEIREWCDVCGDTAAKKYLGLLADRIDNELIELPRDMDGLPIHIGDTVYLDNGSKADVESIELNQDENSVVFIVRGKGFFPSHLSHTRPDSFERIADELDDWSESNRINGDHEVFDRAGNLADRIRKLAKEDE